MAQLQDTDLMLVNRDGKSYKATGAEIKDSLNPSVVTKPQIIAPAEGAGIAIGAESDEIIGVGSVTDPTDYISLVSVSKASYAADRGPEKLWDGELGNAANSCQTDTNGGVITIDVASLNIDAATSEVIIYAAFDATINGLRRITVEGSGTDASLAYFAAGSVVPSTVGAISKFICDGGGGSRIGICGISVDGKLLIQDGQMPQLTFAGNKDLTGDPSFAEGDPIQQDSGHTPQTSAITSVESGQVFSDFNTYWTVGGTATVGNNQERAFDGNENTTCSGLLGSGGNIASGNNGLRIQLTPALQNVEKLEIKVGKNPEAPIGTIHFAVNDDRANTWENPSVNALWFDVSNLIPGSKELTSLLFNLNMTPDQGFDIYGVKVNGSILVDGATKLTLTDDTDLENFRVGDTISTGDSRSIEDAISSNLGGELTYKTVLPGGSGINDKDTVPVTSSEFQTYVGDTQAATVPMETKTPSGAVTTGYGDKLYKIDFDSPTAPQLPTIWQTYSGDWASNLDTLPGLWAETWFYIEEPNQGNGAGPFKGNAGLFNFRMATTANTLSSGYGAAGKTWVPYYANNAGAPFSGPAGGIDIPALNNLTGWTHFAQYITGSVAIGTYRVYLFVNGKYAGGGTTGTPPGIFYTCGGYTNSYGLNFGYVPETPQGPTRFTLGCPYGVTNNDCDALFAAGVGTDAFTPLAIMDDWTTADPSTTIAGSLVAIPMATAAGGSPGTGFGVVSGIDSDNNKMTVANGLGWTNGMTVHGPDTIPATGTVASTDSGNNTMVLASSDETYPKRWIVNQGKYVIGEQFPSKNAAPDADGLTLIATDFVDSPYGSLTHGSSDWQVAAYNDTSYSAPVASATGDATNKTTWEVTPTLEEGTRYRSRVRYKAASGEESPWSDDTTFETKSNPFAQLEPCTLWQNFNGATANWGKIVTPAPVINAGQYYMSDGRRNFAICTDGKIYSSAANTANSSADAVMTPPSNPAISGLTDLVNFWGAYQSSNTNDWVALKTDGSIVNGQGYTDLDGKTVVGFYPLGPVSRMMLLKTDDNEIWCYSMISNSYNIGSETTSNRGLFKLNIGGFPAGVEIVDVVGGTSNNSSGGYDTACLIFLGSDGKIYTSAEQFGTNAINCMNTFGFSTTGTNDAVYQETTFPDNFKNLYGGSTYATEACFSALTEDGDLWFAGLSGNKVTNGNRTFSLFDDTNKYLSGIVTSYQIGNSYTLRADGKLWGKFQNYATTGKDYEEIEVPDYNGTLSSLGGICGNINCYGVALPYPAPI